MDASQWPQGIGVVADQHHNKAMEAAAAAAASASSRPNGNPTERRARPQKEQALNCPRCHSTNTKFCYYNNYSLSQPRYFCKTCRRYWTEGGSLRNVPVGGGSRKNKRPSSSSSSSPANNTSSSKKVVPDHQQNLAPPKININQAHQDLNLGYPSSVLAMENQNPSSCSSSSPHFSAMELLKSTTNGPMSSFIQMPCSDSGTIFPGGFPIHEFKPTVNFCLDGLDQGGGLHENGASARLLFPAEELKQVPSSSHQFDHQNRGQGEHYQSSGYWTGMLDGNSW